jgi:hypothetical protein
MTPPYGRRALRQCWLCNFYLSGKLLAGDLGAIVYCDFISPSFHQILHCFAPEIAEFCLDLCKMR